MGMAVRIEPSLVWQTRNCRRVILRLMAWTAMSISFCWSTLGRMTNLGPNERNDVIDGSKGW
jgi:hypothetical protein